MIIMKKKVVNYWQLVRVSYILIKYYDSTIKMSIYETSISKIIKIYL